MYIHCTLLPYIKAAGEMKTKPTQHSVKELRGLGIQPDMIVVRTEYEMTEDLRDKIALFCDIDKKSVIECRDADTLYQIPVALQAQHMDDLVIERLGLEASGEADLTEWNKLLDTVRNLEGKVKIALVGKYVALQDAYLSVAEALKHAGYEFGKEIEIDWINSEHLDVTNYKERLKDADGILVPGGFGDRGIEGKIESIKFEASVSVVLKVRYLRRNMRVRTTFLS